jgi:protein SCO1/2
MAEAAPRRLRRLLLGAGLLACLPVCAQGRRFHAAEVSGYGKDFTLEDAAGRTVTLADFRGTVVLLFFGFTYCPDICPTELARLAEVMRRLGDDARRVRVVFVTLDPQRDGPAQIRDYAQAFDPAFIGLRGSPAAIAAAAAEFRVFYQRIPGSAPDRYTFDHTAYVYALDPTGRLRLRFDPGQAVEELRADIVSLLREF